MQHNIVNFLHMYGTCDSCGGKRDETSAPGTTLLDADFATLERQALARCFKRGELVYVMAKSKAKSQV